MKSTFFAVCFLFIGSTILVALPRSTVTKESLPGWRKMHVGRVSFYVPPHLRRTGLPGNRGVVAALRGQHDQPYLYYAYGPHIPCTETDQAYGHRMDVTIDGKKAQLEFRIRSEDELLANKKDRHVLSLCVPDVGDGRNKFEIYAASLDLDTLNALKRSFDHIRFR